MGLSRKKPIQPVSNAQTCSQVSLLSGARARSLADGGLVRDQVSFGWEVAVHGS